MADSKSLVWDASGQKYYYTGLSKGVLFPLENGTYGEGVAWNGLRSVSESPSGGEETKLYADDIKYASLWSTEEFGCTIGAYTYPPEFEACLGNLELVPGVTIGQQTHKSFGFSYKTKIGNDLTEDAGYYIHLVYGCTASPSDREYNSINDSPEASELSWEVTTNPVSVTGFKPTASVVIDSRTVDTAKLAAFEKILYGDEAASRLPLPDEVKTLLSAS